MLRLVERLRLVSMLLVIVALGGVALALVVPLPSGAVTGNEANTNALRPIPDLRKDTDALVRQTASRQLIRPPQVTAAVRDNGQARRLLAKLKLQGVLQMNGHTQAYVQVEGQGVVTVREQDSVLDFVVTRIDPAGYVHLSLDGVEVTLSH
ncbi:MAG: hypothetical protein ACIAXF_16370 [Phycisphaerales bacterium JB063]